MKNTIKMVLFLAIVSAISGLSIGIVNNFTAETIEKNAIIAENKNLEVIFPNSEFNEIEYSDSEGIITKVYEVTDKGYIFKATGIGYNSSTPIIALIGMDENGTVVNVVPLQHAETSSVGAKCFNEENVQSLYVGKTVDQEPDVLSGATLTSKAIKSMIIRAQEVYKEVK